MRYLFQIICFFPCLVWAQVADSLSKYSLSELELLYNEKMDNQQYFEAIPYAGAMLVKAKKELDGKDTALAKILYRNADVLEYSGNNENAADYLKEALIIQKSKIPLSPDLASTLHLLGIVNMNLGDYEKAKEYYNEALTLRQRLFGENNKDFASTLGNLGNLSLVLGEYATAENLLKRALDIRKKVLGEQHRDYSVNLTALGNLYFYTGDNTKAESYYKLASSSIKKYLGETHPDYAMSLNNLGLMYFQTGKYNEAEFNFLQTVDAQKKIFGEDNADFASILNNLGLVYRNKGDYQLAENYHLKALRIQKKVLGDKHTEIAQTLNNLGVLYTILKDYTKVETYLLKALEIEKEIRGEMHPNYAQILSSLGQMYYNLSNFAKAEPFMLQALNIERKVLGEAHPNYSNSLMLIGMLYNDMKNYTKAEEHLLKALEITKHNLGSIHPDYAKILNNLGALYEEQGNYGIAESYYLKALEIRKKVPGLNHPDYASSLNNLANLYQAMNELEAAEKYYDEALKIIKKVLGDKHPDYSAGLNNLASLYRKIGKFDLAWEKVLASIAANTNLSLSKNISTEWTDSLFRGDFYVLNTLNQSLLLIFELLQGQKEKQLLIVKAALNTLKRGKNHLSEDDDKLRILRQLNFWILSSMKIFDKNKDASEAFEMAEQNKSVLILDAVGSRRAMDFGLLPDSLVQVEKRFQKKYMNLKAALAEKRSARELEDIQKQFNVLNLEIDAFQKKISSEHPKYAALKYVQDNVPIERIQKLLNKETAILEYVVGDSAVYIFKLDKNSIIFKEVAVEMKILNNHISGLHGTLSNYEKLKNETAESRKDLIFHAHSLYKLLIAPLIDKNSGINHLIIIPDAGLSHIPFEVLLSELPADKAPFEKFNYLINDFKISYNYSAAMQVENFGKLNKHNRKMIAMSAHYVLPDNKVFSDFRLPAHTKIRALLNELPAAKKEVEALQMQFDGFFAFDGMASERVFKEKAGEYAVIHLAMHGLLDRDNPILSALAFSEDGDSFENNFLQAFEIAKMELNADLVVLSACETGFGKFETGNGTASLARAFMYAGVPSLVVSLWQVNDVSTSQIMQLFYQNLAQGMDKAAALRSAKLDYMKTVNNPLAGHPAFWSPFILIGNDKAIVIRKIKSDLFSFSTIFIFAILSILLLFGLFFILKRKRKLLS
jgi:CHAT domain-containing protein/Flp pilus assembly protein TadD